MGNLFDLDINEETKNFNQQITDGEVDIIDAGKKVYKAYKAMEAFWKQIQEEVYNECEEKYHKQELTNMGITLRSTRKADPKSFAVDSEWNLAVETKKSREGLMKAAYKYFQDTGKDYVVGGEIIPQCKYGGSSKSVSFK